MNCKTMESTQQLIELNNPSNIVNIDLYKFNFYAQISSTQFKLHRNSYISCVLNSTFRIVQPFSVDGS